MKKKKEKYLCPDNNKKRKYFKNGQTMRISGAQSFQMRKWRQLLSTRLMLCPPAPLALAQLKASRKGQFSGNRGTSRCFLNCKQAASMPTPHCQGFILGHPSIPVPYSERSYRDSREGLSVHETQVRGDGDSRNSQPCTSAEMMH